MPFHGQAGLVHRAVLWKRIGTGVNARPVVSNVAEALDCRWDWGRRVVTGPDGQPIAVDATVSTDREIDVGSAMWKGDIDDLPGTGQSPNRDVMEVITCSVVDDWRGVDSYFEVTLVRSGEGLYQTATEPEA